MKNNNNNKIIYVLCVLEHVYSPLHAVVSQEYVGGANCLSSA